MISLEQVRLLEERVSKAIDYFSRVNSQNIELKKENTELAQRLNVFQKRIDELEEHILRFKEDHSRIEDGIIAALDRLSQFEEAFENSLREPVNNKPDSNREEKKTDNKAAGTNKAKISQKVPEKSEKPADSIITSEPQNTREDTETVTKKASSIEKNEKNEEINENEENNEFFEITENETQDDASIEESEEPEESELDIF